MPLATGSASTTPYRPATAIAGHSHPVSALGGQSKPPALTRSGQARLVAASVQNARTTGPVGSRCRPGFAEFGPASGEQPSGEEPGCL